ncbi:MAG: type II toxin-antitoxin system VapB family antitoxin [Myxococcota bacterium]
MALSIKDQEADRLARLVAELTGESLTEAVTVALRERVERLRDSSRDPWRADAMRQLRLRAASLTVIDERSADEVIGYGDDGAPR